MSAASFSQNVTRLRSPAVMRRISSARLQIFCRESRIGKAPIPVPKSVQVTLEGASLSVKGPLGSMHQTFSPTVKLELDNGILKVTRVEESREGNSQHGLSRTLAANMITGVSSGFEKRLELVGTGYRSSVAGKELTLNVGYSKPRILPIPEGVKVVVEKNTTVVVSGYNKVTVGDFCATIIRQRPPEPYKGKGVRYAGQVIKLKEGKSAGAKKK